MSAHSLFSRLTDLVGNIAVVPSMPVGRSAIVNDVEQSAPKQASDERSGLSYFIAYDGGSLSHRRITVKRLHIEGTMVKALLAFCHERTALRLFRTDRITEVVDIHTGEVLTSRELCNALMNRGIPIAEQRLAAMIRILVFMARCDGTDHFLEWEEIDRSLIRLSRCLMDNDMLVDELLNDARRLAPDGNDFIKALKGLTKTRLPQRMHEELRRGIGAVIEADGLQHSQEVHWAIEASEYIAKMPTSS